TQYAAAIAPYAAAQLLVMQTDSRPPRASGASASHRGHTRLVWRRSIRCEVDSVRKKCTGTQTLERLRSHSRSFSGARSERRLPAIELLPPLAVELAGIGEGRVPRTRQHRLRVRPLRAQPLLRDAAALRGVAQVLREAGALSSVHAVQRVPARPVPVPVLRIEGRPDLRPPDPALARRPDA